MEGASLTTMDVISLVSAVLTLAGLLLAIYEARRARKASLNAQEAAQAARDASLRSAAVIDLSSTIKALGEIKSLHRAAAIDVLPPRYEALRHSIAALRQRKAFDDPKIQKTMQSLVSKLAGVEKILDQGVTLDEFKIQVPRLNALITKSMDEMQALMVAVAHEEAAKL